MAMSRAIRGLGSEEPIRELINKERRYQDGFMERALNPPPKPHSPPPVRPPTALDKLVAIGSVPAGDKMERPLSAKSKMSIRSKRSSAVAQQFRERLEAAEAALKSEFSGPGNAHLWAMQKTLLADVKQKRGKGAKGGVGGNRATQHGPPPSRAGRTGVKSHIARPHTAVHMPPGVKEDNSNEPDGVTGFGHRPPTAAPRPLTSTTRPGSSAVVGAGSKSGVPALPATSRGKGEIDIVGYKGEPWEQVKPMVLNLDNLEDSTVEVLLHELHKVEEEEEEEEREEEVEEEEAAQVEIKLSAVEEGEGEAEVATVKE